jgi:predicted protein tyrosine phosphatase
MKNILFLCSQNKLRSPTAESIFCDIDGWDVRSAGLNTGAEVYIRLKMSSGQISSL